MVKKAVVVMTIVTMMAISYTSLVTKRQPLEATTVEFESEVETKKDEIVHPKVEKTEVAQQSTISPYDPIFIAVCSEYGNDWRFMSAMAYHESRFNPDVTSRQGAQGMMQIMPNVAKFFNVEKEDLSNVETNIMVANLLVNRINKMLKLPESTPERDRMAFVLASYNGGIGYVLNARKLARTNGENANSWDVVSKYLASMKCADYAQENNVRQFRGVGQTLAYVDNVRGHYDLYCQIAML